MILTNLPYFLQAMLPLCSPRFPSHSLSNFLNYLAERHFLGHFLLDKREQWRALEAQRQGKGGIEGRNRKRVRKVERIGRILLEYLRFSFSMIPFDNIPPL